jgi:hypothetical protein
VKNKSLSLLVLLLFGCTTGNSSVSPLDSNVMDVTVGPKKVGCVGVAPMECLVVDGSLFYQRIEGFEYVEGYEYKLQIKRIKVYTKDTVPADASLYRYELINLISKRKIQ